MIDCINTEKRNTSLRFGSKGKTKSQVSKKKQVS